MQVIYLMPASPELLQSSVPKEETHETGEEEYRLLGYDAT
jgi:hypothetical protein